MTPDPVTIKRKFQRSPNYPLVSLGEALGKLKVIYDHEKRSKAPFTVILKHLGYGEQRGGVGGRTLSTLIQYGLLDQNRGECWISDLGYTLLHFPESSSEMEAALKEAAQNPTLFRELLATYKDGLPSDDTMRSYLIKRGFNPAKTEGFIRVFRDTVGLAKATPGVYDVPETEEQQMPTLESPAGSSSSQGQPGRTTIPGTHVFTWTLSIPRNVRAELRLSGNELKIEDVRRLKKQIESLEEAFQDSKEN